MKHLEEKIKVNLYELGLGNSFFNKTPKAQMRKEKN